MTDTHIILASGSSARQKMLRNAGVAFDIVPADIDEEIILLKMQSEGATPQDIALKLAQEKALCVSAAHPDHYVIGSDQVLSMNDALYSKAQDKNEAREHLLQFQGQDHYLSSAVCVIKAGHVLWDKVDVAQLTMKSMNMQDIDKYIEKSGDTITSCVGCYALESIGVRLFKEIQGDYFTILGMPLLPLLNFLDEKGASL